VLHFVSCCTASSADPFVVVSSVCVSPYISFSSLCPYIYYPNACSNIHCSWDLGWRLVCIMAHIPLSITECWYECLPAQDLVLAGANDSHNWRSIVLSLLVIGFVIVGILTAIYLLGYVDEMLYWSGQRMKLGEYLQGDLTPRRMPPVWISHTHFVFQTDDGALAYLDTTNDTVSLLVTNHTLVSPVPCSRTHSTPKIIDHNSLSKTRLGWGYGRIARQTAQRTN